MLKNKHEERRISLSNTFLKFCTAGKNIIDLQNMLKNVHSYPKLR